jgi:hypothetical protein
MELDLERQLDASGRRERRRCRADRHIGMELGLAEPRERRAARVAHRRGDDEPWDLDLELDVDARRRADVDGKLAAAVRLQLDLDVDVGLVGRRLVVRAE